jgi:DNA-binding CsgD family transcriptional regulator
MPLADGIAFALAEPVPAAGAWLNAGQSKVGRRLSRRELDVVRLVSKGMTDRQIAARLSISPRTVDSHMRRIFTKVGASSKAAVAAYAVEQHLA